MKSTEHITLEKGDLDFITLEEIVKLLTYRPGNCGVVEFILETDENYSISFFADLHVDSLYVRSNSVSIYNSLTREYCLIDPDSYIDDHFDMLAKEKNRQYNEIIDILETENSLNSQFY